MVAVKLEVSLFLRSSADTAFFRGNRKSSSQDCRSSSFPNAQTFPFQLHFFKLVLCHGYLRHIMLVEIPLHHVQQVSDLNWDVESGQKYSTGCFSHLNLYQIR